MASFRRGLLIALGCGAFIYAAAYADLVLRARSAYLEGEKYLLWNEKPELKKAALDAELAETEDRIRKAASAEKLSPALLEQRLKLARFERDERVKESSLKYACAWFQTAAELFSPPESKWVRLSRERLASAKTLWKKELDAKKIPYQDYMLD